MQSCFAALQGVAEVAQPASVIRLTNLELGIHSTSVNENRNDAEMDEVRQEGFEAARVRIQRWQELT